MEQRVQKLRDMKPEVWSEGWNAWNAQMNSQLELHARAQDRLAKLRVEQPPKKIPASRAWNFAGLTADELDEFHSADPSTLSRLRDCLKRWISATRAKLKEGQKLELWQSKIQADEAWVVAVKLLKRSPSVDLAKQPSAKLTGQMLSTEAVEPMPAAASSSSMCHSTAGAVSGHSQAPLPSDERQQSLQPLLQLATPSNNVGAREASEAAFSEASYRLPSSLDGAPANLASHTGSSTQPPTRLNRSSTDWLDALLENDFAVSSLHASGHATPPHSTQTQ